MQFEEIIHFLEETFPLNHQETYDNSGLLIKANASDCTGILCALDLTLEVAEEALEKKCNLILTHHPFWFYPIKKIGHQTLTEKLLRFCIQNNLAVYAAHTNVDKSPIGLNSLLASYLGIQNVQFLKKESPQSGLGVWGILEKPILATVFFESIQQILEVSHLRYSLGKTEMVQKIGLSTGSGGSLWPEALAQNLDVFITSDLKYHDFFDAKKQLFLVDIGHYESEKHAASLFYSILSKKFPIFAVYKTKQNTNPIFYL